MNRRKFIQSLVAVISLPVTPSFSIRAATPALAATAAVPAHARSWAIYMSTLHGECTPQTLQNLLNIPATDAKNYVTQLIVDGALKPNPFLQRSVSELAKANDSSVLEKVKKRLEMKVQADSKEDKIYETFDAPECLDAKAELEDHPEVSLDVFTED